MVKEDFFFIIIPTGAGKADIETLWKWSTIPVFLNKRLFPITVYNKGISASRTAAFNTAKNTLDKMGVKHGGKIRALLLDDDIILPTNLDLRVIVDAFKKADENNWNLIANYRVQHTATENGMVNVMMKRKKDDQYSFYSDSDLAKLKTFDELPDTVSGLGFYYGEINLDYQFHYDDRPEDINFFRDNKIQLRYLDLRLYHEKKIYI
jgi:hypothetical protein